MIREAIISTCGPMGPNFAPMGVRLNQPDLDPGDGFQLLLYLGSRTRANLEQLGQGVVNFTDQCGLFVETALFDGQPPHQPGRRVPVPHLCAATLYWEFELTTPAEPPLQDPAQPRTVQARILACGGTGRASQPGFCRAQSALIEATILVSRLAFGDPQQLQQSLAELQTIVAKTGGPEEAAAWQRLCLYLAQQGLTISPNGGMR